MQEFTLNDFSGGIVDDDIDCKFNQYRTANNLLINGNDLETIKGSKRICPEIFTTGFKVDKLAIHRGVLFSFDSKDSYYMKKDNGPVALSRDKNHGNIFGSWGESSEENHYHTYGSIGDHLFINRSDESPVYRVKKSSERWSVAQAGLPEINKDLISIEKSEGEEYSYIYGFYLSQKYVSEKKEYLVNGPVTFINFKCNEMNAKITISKNINDLFKLRVRDTDFKSEKIKVNIFRSLKNEKTLYKVREEVLSGQEILFTDSNKDEDVKNNQKLHTSGYLPQDTQPPICKGIHCVDNTLLYGGIKNRYGTYPNRFGHSKKGIPQSCPGEFYYDLDDEFVTASSIKKTFIIFCKNSVYRVDRLFNNDGKGQISASKISDHGTESPLSIIQTQDGIFYASYDGFYFCNGINSVKVSHHINKKFSKFSSSYRNRQEIYGTFDVTNSRLYWSVNEGSMFNSKIYIGDISRGISKEIPFTTMEENSKIWSCTSIIFKDGILLRGTIAGHIHEHSLSKLVHESCEGGDNWIYYPLNWQLETGSFSFGQPHRQKFVPKFGIVLKKGDGVNVSFSSINNFYKSSNPGKGIIYIPQKAEWVMNPGYREYNSKILITERTFEERDLNCFYKGINLFNGDGYIDSSKENQDKLSLVSIDKYTTKFIFKIPDQYYIDILHGSKLVINNIIYAVISTDRNVGENKYTLLTADCFDSNRLSEKDLSSDFHWKLYCHYPHAKFDLISIMFYYDINLNETTQNLYDSERDYL